MHFRLSIVIPVFNRFNFTEACINDLFKLPEDHEIIIVDNHSTDETSILCRGLAGGVNKPPARAGFNYIRNESNEGFARASNSGFSVARGQHIMFLNNDIRVQKDHNSWTAPIIDTLDREPQALVGPTIGILNEKLDFVKETNCIEGQNWYMSGWNISARRETWNKLILKDHKGPFTTEFGLAYFEDTDLSFRARELGFDFSIVPVPVVHFGRVTSKSIGLAGLYKPAQDLFKKKWLKNGN